MAIRIVKLGSKRRKREGLRIGTVRYHPRGVPKSEYASRDYYDVWFPNLAPSRELMATFKEALAKNEDSDDDQAWRRFRKGFLREMKSPCAVKDLDLLAALSRTTDFSIGCYCDDEERCHRSILRELLIDREAEVK